MTGDGGAIRLYVALSVEGYIATAGATSRCPSRYLPEQVLGTLGHLGRLEQAP